MDGSGIDGPGTDGPGMDRSGTGKSEFLGICQQNSSEIFCATRVYSIVSQALNIKSISRVG